MKAIGAMFVCSLFMFGCSTFQTAGLYELPADTDNKPNINGFYQVEIFNDDINGEVWFSKEPSCLQVSAERKEVQSGDGGINITWNKQAGGCPWLGMGFGWSNWTGKDISNIANSAAVSFWAKSKKGGMKGLPWAIAFEDYSGGQAWSGVTADCVVGGIIGESWTQVIIPLERFNLIDAEIDPSTVKQMLFQFESSGTVWIDEISIVPFTPVGPKEVEVEINTTPKIDGVVSDNEWPENSFVMDCGTIKVTSDADYFYIAGKIVNDLPFMNNQSGKDIWNGDAVEIAFSTNSKADVKRKIYYSTDHHIGIQLGGSFEVYDWQDQKPVRGIVIDKTISNDTMIFEVSIPWSSLATNAWEKENVYGIELAVDLSGKDGNRKEQVRWNTPGREGFNTDPSVWGKAKIN